MKLPKEIWMCENEQARWFEFEQPHDLPNDVVITKMVSQRTWVGLTDEDWDYLNKYCGSTRSAIQTAETLLKEKNT